MKQTLRNAQCQAYPLLLAIGPWSVVSEHCLRLRELMLIWTRLLCLRSCLPIFFALLLTGAALVYDRLNYLYDGDDSGSGGSGSSSFADGLPVRSLAPSYPALRRSFPVSITFSQFAVVCAA